MASNMQYTATASLSINGITPLTGPTENVAVSVNYSSGILQADDSMEEVYTINANTPDTAIDMGLIVTGKAIWIQTNSPVILSLQQDLGAGPVWNKTLVSSMVLLPVTFTGVRLANAQGTAAKVALALAGDRAAVGGGPGIY